MRINIKLTLAYVFSTLLLCACGGPSSEDLLPSNLSQIDANTAALIREQVAKINKQPRDGDLYLELGLIYEANLLWPEARRAYAAAVELEPTSMWWRYHLAIATRTAGEQEEALRLWRNLAAEFPGSAPVQQRLGEALIEVNELEAAAEAYRRLIAQEPGLPEGYHGLGEVRLLQRDYAAARELLEQAVVLDPAYRALRYSLGLAYRGLGMAEEAQRELERGVDAQPRYLPDPLAERLASYQVNLPARRDEAAAMLLNGENEQAARILEEVLAQQPGNTTDLNNLAVAYMRMGRFMEATTRLQEASKLAPEKFTTWLNLSNLALRTGRPDSALEFAQAAVKRAPENSQNHVALAMAQEQLGQLELTAASLERARELDGRNPQVHGMLAEVNVRLGRLDLAEQNFRDVLGILPDSLTAVLGLGRLYLQQGQVDQASAMLATAKRLAPGRPQVGAFELEVQNYSAGEPQ